MIQRIFNFPCENINLCNTVNFITKKLHPHCRICIICRIDFHHVPSHPEGSTVKVSFIPVILNINQFSDDFIPVLLHSWPKRDDHILIVIRTSNSINTGYAGNNDNISPLAQRRRRRKTEFVNFIVYRRILGNVCVRRRHVGFRLIVVIVGYKILHCVLREEFLKLTVQLCCKCFIVRKYQSWLIKLGDNIRHGEGLTGACDTQQSLELVAFLEAFDQFFDGLRLVAGWFVFGVKFEDLL